MKKFKFVVILLFPFIGEGFAFSKSPVDAVGSVKIMFKSVPSGAIIIENHSDKVLGIAPVVVEYFFKEEALLNGASHSFDVSARWPDGRFSKLVSIFLITPEESDYDFVYIFVAPLFDKEKIEESCSSAECFTLGAK